MIFNILNIRFKILKNRITNEFSKKDIINIVLFIIISMIGLIFFIVHLLKKFNVSYSSVVVANNLILFVTCILMTSTIPLKIYKDYFKNQKIEILFLSPVTLKQCFLYQIIILLAKILSIYFVITLPLLIAFVYKLNLNIIYILNYIIYNSIFLSIFSLILHLFVFLIALITNAKYIKKVLVVVTGIIEIIFTSMVILITNYFNITDIISKANNNHIIHIFIKFNKMIINQHTIKASLLILLVLLYTIIYIITYGIFYKIYYIKGLFINNSDNVLCYNKQLIKIKFLSNFYFYQKDKKLLFRNFDRLKSIIFTLIIFIIITIFTIKNSKNDIFIFLLIINHFMSLTILFQIIYDNINIEQDKTDLFSLSGISKYDFYIQKNFYSRIVPAIYIFIYNFIILIMFNLQIKQIIIYLLINLFTIFIGSSLVTLISIYMNNIETYSFKNLFYMVKYISKILIYYAIILLITIIALSKYILLGIVIIILLNKITNKLIYFRLTHSIS